MNSTDTAKPEPTGAVSAGDDLVGVALYPLAPQDGKAIIAALFYEEMETRIRASGIEPARVGGLFGLGFIVWTTLTPDRNPVLRAIERIIREMGYWEICEISFFDRAEGYWRTIHPHDALPFGRFFSEDNFKAARLQVGLTQEEILNVRSDLLALLRRLRGEPQ